MRIECPHFSSCSGCILSEKIEEPHSFKEATQFFAALGIPHLKLRYGKPIQWRCRAKLAVRGVSSSPQIGLFEEGSHRVVNIPFCQLHHPLINRAVDILRNWIMENHVSPYDETSGKGILRYAQLTVERRSGKVQLVLVVNSTSDHGELPLKILWERDSVLWHSLWVNFNSRRDNVILGSIWKRYYGEEWLLDEFLGKNVCFHPGSFMQANLEMFEQLLKSLYVYVPQNAQLIEFFAGVGAIALSIAEKCSAIECVEIAPAAMACFEEACKWNEGIQEKVTFISEAAEKQLKILEKPFNVAVVDPPRKGLSPVLLEALSTASSLKRLIYISCGWESFQRDCEKLLSKGWKIHAAEAFLFFPGSDFIELLCIFDKS